METPGGRYARQWENYRQRRRWFWIVCLGYPLAAVAIGYPLRDLLSSGLGLSLVIGWPIAILVFARWMTAWPCPQCGKSFFYVHPGGSENVFTVRACGYCGLPKWAHAGGTPPAPASARVALRDATRPREACWFCGRADARGPALELHGIDPRQQIVLLTIPRCRKCALAHALGRGLGGALLGLVAFAGVGWLFARGIDVRAGFPAALGRFLPFIALAFVATLAAGGVGMALSRPALWRSRPLDDWIDHPEVTRYKAAGWQVWRTESSGIDVSTT